MARRHEANVAAQDPLQERAHERIVGAAEDHGVDVRAVQRRAVGADVVHHRLGEREAALDDRREVGRRDLGDVEPAVLLGERAQVGAALDGRRRREHADPPESVIAAAISASGSITATTSTPARRRDLARARRGRRVAAELQAITTSFAPRSSRNRVLRSTHSRSSSSVLAPYGKRASSPR